MKIGEEALKFEGIEDASQRKFLLNLAFLKVHRSGERVPSQGHSKNKNVVYDRTWHVMGHISTSES